jgi:hypothetical protein
MPQLTRNPEIDLTPDFHQTVHEWIEESGEILVIMRRLYCMGDIEFALISSGQQFDLLVEHCPEGTKVIVTRSRPVPIMGTVDPAFIDLACDALSSEEEYVLMTYPPRNAFDPRCSGETDYVKYLRESLEYRMGESIAVLPCPRNWHVKSDAVIYACKGGVDGPR